MKQLILEIIALLNEGRSDIAVNIADVKSNAGNSINKHLIDLHKAGTITMQPKCNSRSITDADKKAAVIFGDEALHTILIG